MLAESTVCMAFLLIELACLIHKSRKTISVEEKLSLLHDVYIHMGTHILLVKQVEQDFILFLKQFLLILCTSIIMYIK
jgi:hypothetical protein